MVYEVQHSMWAIDFLKKFEPRQLQRNVRKRPKIENARCFVVCVRFIQQMYSVRWLIAYLGLRVVFLSGPLRRLTGAHDGMP